MTGSYQRHFNKIKKNKGAPVERSLVSKPQKKTSTRLLVGPILGTLLLIIASFFTKEILSFWNRIELGFFESSRAEVTGAQTAMNKSEEKQSSEKPSQNPDGETKKEPPKDMVKALDEEKVDHLVYVNEKLLKIEQREAELSKMESEIEVQKAEVQKQLKELEELRASISNQLSERVTLDSQKVDSLVQMYTNMKPPQAARVFEAMDEDLAVEIIGRMKRKPAADIMNLLKPEKAKSISEKQAGYKRR